MAAWGERAAAAAAPGSELLQAMGWSAVEWISEQTLRNWLESDG